jgi:hypothetical protein
VKSLSLLVCLPGLLLFGVDGRAEPFELRDGDRVVLIGSTLIEREQRYGYWETALTSQYPNRNIQFRNLGWSGDTVFGEAQAGFGTPADGFRHLKDHVLALKPTVILIGYGTNESFDGPAALPRFVKGLNALLDSLAPTQARLVLLSPLRQENLGRPLPDPTAQNKNLHLYGETIRAVATKRDCSFVDFYDLLGKASLSGPLTDNGIHLTGWGYWYSANSLEGGLGWPERSWRVEIDAVRKSATPHDTQVTEIQTAPETPLAFRVLDRALPVPPSPKEGAPPGSSRPSARLLRITGLVAGSFTLTVDGKPVAMASQEEWARGVALDQGPEFEQAETLRTAIVAKNRLYFHRWRPQNETYLFGFRKHEQGQNAREIPQFDPLIAKQEVEIARLRKPVEHHYQLKPAPTKNLPKTSTDQSGSKKGN